MSDTTTLASAASSDDTTLDRASAPEAASPAWWWRTRPLLALTWVVAVAPTFLAGWWAIANDVWMAGDRSIMGVLTHDVFSRHTPQLATVSTLGIYTDGQAGPSVHHLGPAQFWALAPIDWVFGGRPMGLVVGAMVLNGAAIAVALIYANRRIGPVGTALMTLVCTLLSFGLGPTILRDIWTPFLGLWPIFALAVVVWSLLEGDRWALPVATVLVSFLVQIELVFVAPAFVLAAVGVAGLVRRARREPAVGKRAALPAGDHTSARRAEPPSTDDDLFVTTGEVPEVSMVSAASADEANAGPWYQSLLPPAAASAIIAVFLWSPVAFQEANGQPGNLTLLWRSLGKQKGRAGWGFVGHNLVALFEFRPVWTRRIESPIGLGTDVGLLQYTTALLVAGAFVAITRGIWLNRRQHPTLLTLCATAWAAVVAGVANLIITPAEGIIGLQYRRWMWPIGAWMWFAFLVAGGTLLVDRMHARALTDAPPLADHRQVTPPRRTLRLDLADPRRAVGVLLAVALVTVLPASIGQTSPPTADIADNRVVASMWPGLVESLPRQPTYVTLGGARSGFGFGPEIVRRLIVRGYEVWVPSFAADSYGDHRVLPADLAVPQRLQIGSSDVSLAPTEVPTRLLAAGRADGRSAAAFVTTASAILGRVRGMGPLQVSDQGKQQLSVAYQSEHPGDKAAQYAQKILADPSLAMFDAAVLKLHIAGQVVASPITPDDARQLLDGLDGVAALAFLYPGPQPSSGG